MANVLPLDKQIAVISSLCESSSIRSIESFQGRTIWDGVVEVRLKGHPKADKVYAWIHTTDDPAHPKRHVTVLHIPPVVSPKTAVQAAIVQEARERGNVN